MAGSSGRSRFHIVDCLNAEWNLLTLDSRGSVVRWAERHQALTPCRCLGDVLLAIRREPDAALSALLTEVLNNDQLAGRVVVQSMLGKLVRMAQLDEEHEVGDYISAFWCVLKAYPLAARPRKIAANLVLDTLKQVRRERCSSSCHGVVPWPPGAQLDEAYEQVKRRDSLDHQWDIAGVTAPDVLDAARRLGAVSVEYGRLLSSVYIEGMSGTEAASRHQITAGSVRVRCSRAVEQLRRHLPQLLAVARESGA
jgi:DNA-directed RNA polymerase specialized sigma24 family protein